MATLFDLAQQYLNRALPETFRYTPRTTPPVEDTPVEDNVSTPARILPMPSGGGDGFSVYNPDPNSISNKNYSPYAYRQALSRSDVGIPSQIQTSEFLYGPQLTGIPGAIASYAKASIPGQLIGKGLDALGNMLPVNRRAIYENELASEGIMVNDIGQIVSDGGNINTAQNIMAGYNAAKVDADTFAKRRAVIEKNMKDPVQKAAKLKALDEAEAIMLGTAKKRTDMIFDDKSKQKDPDYKSTQELIDLGIQAADDDSEDDMYDGGSILDTTTPTGPTYGPYSPTGPIVTGPTYGPYSGGGGGITYGQTTPKTKTSGSILADKKINKIDDYITIGGGGQDNDGPITTPDYSNVTTAKGPPGQISKPSFGTGSGGLGDYQIQPSKPTKSLKTTKPGTGGGADSGGSSSGGGKIVCTMMNESYGFGSFRNKIWLKHSKGLAPEYQKGYHKLFLPLVKIAKTNKVVRKILEHIAVHRTIDIRQESRGKVHLLGRVYRKILEPLCYFVGKHG